MRTIGTSFMAAIVAAILTFPLHGVTLPAQAVENGAECTQQPPGFENRENRQSRCINGRLVRTDGYIRSTCFRGVEHLPINRGTCSEANFLQIERIAQARLINRLGGTASEGAFWETRIARKQATTTSSGRVDVVTYPATSSNYFSNPVELYEVKLENNGTLAKASQQLDEYVAGARATLWPTARRGTALAAYSDIFEDDNAHTCSDGRRVPATFTAAEAPGASGVLLIRKRPVDCKNDEPGTGESPKEEETSRPEEQPEPTPTPTPTDPSNDPPRSSGLSPSH